MREWDGGAEREKRSERDMGQGAGPRDGGERVRGKRERGRERQGPRAGHRARGGRERLPRD